MAMRLRGNARLVCALLLVLLCVASQFQGGASRGGGGGRGGRIGGGGSSDGGSTGGGGTAVPGAGGGGGGSYMRGAGGSYVPTRGYGGRNTTATGSDGWLPNSIMGDYTIQQLGINLKEFKRLMKSLTGFFARFRHCTPLNIVPNVPRANGSRKQCIMPSSSWVSM
ncbi:hypothetical protein TRIUR3_00280 [Triticum urartu]|uniref:Uncharacterized protein n=1 Tax=Triticum urartu TaxID=4572 RepID=M7Z9G7_TRIUA|nr:hypothetical protein TRIUR3_00280 [Triticum urartu]